MRDAVGLPATPRERRAASLHRGLVRLGLSLALTWFVFWTFAYVLQTRSSENAQQQPALTPATKIAVLATALLSLPWVVSGFRAR